MQTIIKRPFNQLQKIALCKHLRFSNKISKKYNFTDISVFLFEISLIILEMSARICYNFIKKKYEVDSIWYRIVNYGKN